MPTYNDAVINALEAAEATRTVAHVTHDLDSPEATYRILGALSSTLWSLRQTLDQLAAWHERTSDGAFSIDAPPPSGRELSRQVANHLRFAAHSVARAGAHVDKGWNHNARIFWSQSAGQSAVATRHPTPAPTDGFGR